MHVVIGLAFDLGSQFSLLAGGGAVKSRHTIGQASKSDLSTEMTLRTARGFSVPAAASTTKVVSRSFLSDLAKTHRRAFLFKA